MSGEGSKAPVILVVDDESHITHVLALKLRNAGYDVHDARDGEEGFETAQRLVPDLIITDLQMPYMTGVEMCAKLKERQETAHIPVLLLTARGYSLEEADLARTNIVDVLSKPFSPREILEQVRTHLGAGDATQAEADAA